ncbi:hypothetical protein KEJ19_00880 [Candidatus Bathyarchaeota archaeon]|nr:hypothetical protein [Candidatus Bathyarchaeota archaeon]
MDERLKVKLYSSPLGAVTLSLRGALSYLHRCFMKTFERDRNPRQIVK